MSYAVNKKNNKKRETNLATMLKTILSPRGQ